MCLKRGNETVRGLGAYREGTGVVQPAEERMSRDFILLVLFFFFPTSMILMILWVVVLQLR